MPRKREQPFSSEDIEPVKKRQKVVNTRLERKREQDRVAQRAIREKTRNHIANLEDLVQTLQSDKSNGKIARLVAQLDEKNAEINRLRTALNNITRITSAICHIPAAINSGSATCERHNQLEEVSPSTPPNEEGHDSVFKEVADTNPVLEATHNDDYTRMSFNSPQDDIQNRPRSVSTTSVTGAILAGSPAKSESDESNVMSISQLASSITGNTRLEGRLWYLAGTLLNHIRKQPHQPAYSATFDEDIAIRAVVEGWSAVMERYPLDRGWQWLKELDETIYFDTSIPGRLSHLRLCRLQFLHQMSPEKGWDQMLPAFLAARPSQRYLDHDPLIEYFAWPSLRERLLFYPRKYATDRFMEALRQNLVFTWTHGTSELYVKDPSTGRYSYSDIFLKHVTDIRHHTVKPAFFDHFPELRADIPCNDTSPAKSLSPRVQSVNNNNNNNDTKPFSAAHGMHIWDIEDDNTCETTPKT